jgi:anti-sigma regulatory factor (Ser/Thr protein kinase)
MSQLALAVMESSQVGEARRQAAAMAGRLGFDAGAAGRAALVVTEAATNIVKHAKGGEILLRALEQDAAAGIELIALDRGPGMDNVAGSMRDGHSTAGSPGLGLGSLARAASGLEIYSQPGKGTVLRCELWANGAGAPADAPGKLRVGAICLPKPGESVAGDDWMLASENGRHVLMVVDGLGHGPDAAAAARTAKAVLAHSTGSPRALLDAVHHGLRSTRGAAAAVALLQPARRTLAYAGIGNITGVIRHAQKTRHLISHGGILGHQVSRIHEIDFPFPDDSLLIMHSDGVSAHWDLEDYPGLEARHPGVIAAVLYRDHARGRDDVTVAVVRNRISA